MSKNDDLYNSIQTKITIPGDGRGDHTYAVRLHGNAKNSQITLVKSTQTFPKGKYTLTGSFFTQNLNELEVGFFFGSYSTETRVKYTGGNDTWNSLETTFESDGTTEKAIGVFFKHNNSGNAMIAGADNITLSYENVNGDMLNNLLIRANGINAKLSNDALASAITSAQTVYDGINNTIAYQTSIDGAITSLSGAINTAISGYTFDPEGDDISWLIANNGFESSEARTGNIETTTRVNYSSTGWTLTSEGGNSASGILAYAGEGNQINLANIPATDNKTEMGKALGISIGWNTTIAYQSTLPITLPAGSYVLRINGYNAGTATLFNSKFGFVPTLGDASLSTKTSFPLNTWDVDEVSFTLENETEGNIQIGGTATNTTSTNHGKVFFDNITLTYYNPLTLAQIQWQEVHDALAALDATALPDAAEGAITTELAKSVPTTTAEDVNTAKAALQALIDSYDEIKVAYDKALALIAFATAEKDNSTGDKSTFATAISTATTDIETRTTAAALEEDYSTLETARQTYVISGAQPTADHVFDLTFKIADAAVTGTGWSASGTASGQQYTDAPDNKYFDCGWNTSLNKNQPVESLPAGYYTLKAATRAKASEVTSANIYVNQTRTELNRSTDNNRNGSTGGELGNGWSWTQVNFELRATGGVTVGFYAETTGQGWAGADDFHLYYKGNAVDDETADALIATVVSGKMNSTVADAQSSALSTFESAQTIENYEALETAIAEANNSVAAYAEVNTAIAAAEAVTLVGSTLDISTQKNAYDNGTMLDSDKDATITAIKAALTTALFNQTLEANITALMTNPSFEDGTTGWAAQFSATASRSWGAEDNDDATDGDNVLTMHTDNGYFTGFAVDQAVTLPAGYYKLTADVISTNVEVDTYIFASTNTTWSGKEMATLSTAKVETADTWESLETIFYVDAEKTVYLGVTTESGNWNGAAYANYKADNFKLYYLGDASATMSITDAQYATFIAPYDVTIPSGVTAYTVNDVESNGSTLTLVEVTTTISANVPVVLFSESVINETTYERNTATEVSYTEGLLTGVYANTDAPDNSYVLAKINDKVAFYLVDNDDKPTVGANRCYLTAPAPARALYFPGNEGTGIEAVNALTSGEVKIFNASGAQIPALQKGMNIVKQSNGKSYKVIVK